MEDKASILSSFAFMKGQEYAARDFYTQVADDPATEAEVVSTVLKHIASDEERHAAIVQEIIDIVENAL